MGIKEWIQEQVTRCLEIRFFDLNGYSGPLQIIERILGSPRTHPSNLQALNNSSVAATAGALQLRRAAQPAEAVWGDVPQNGSYIQETWRFMVSYKRSYKSPNIGYKYSYPTYNPTYNSPSTSKEKLYI